MNIEEFSNEFDILLNSFSRSNEFGNLEGIELDEYEKSIFLTQAQKEIILELYKGNGIGSSFENTEEVRRYLSILVKTYTTTNKVSDNMAISTMSYFFKLPEDTWFITYESVDFEDINLKGKDNKNIIVVPVTQDDYNRIKNNPFKSQSERRVLRLDVEKNMVELISKYKIKVYLVRYISKPSPIVLENLPEPLSIEGVKIKTECKLNPVLHRAILDRAVRLAISTKSINTGK